MVGLFALLGFAYVPLGSRTGLEHTIALLRTAPARDALDGLVNAATRAKEKLADTLFPEVRQSLPLPLPTAERPVKPLVPRLPPPQRDTTR